MLIEFLSNAQISDLSGRFDYPTGPQTTGAYLDIFHLTILHRPHPTEVGEPTPFGSVIGVRDIIADLRSLAADITEFEPWKAPPLCLKYIIYENHIKNARKNCIKERAWLV